MSSAEPITTKEKKKKKSKGDFRDKSTNASKKPKPFIELARIVSCSNSRGVSADKGLDNAALKKVDKQFKTTKTNKSKLLKVSSKSFKI